MAAAGRGPPLLSLRSITKVYPGGVVANDNVSLDLYEGEVLALLGENGAGKTTLVSIIAGYQRPDRGEILLEGKRVVFNSPRDAIRRGIVLVPQHPKLIEEFTVAENIVLSYKVALGKKVGMEDLRELARLFKEKYGFSVELDRRVRSLTMGERQRAELLKALALNAKILLLDEPTTHLSPVESEKLVLLVKDLAASGRTIVVITHRIKEALAMADRIAVMRKGRLVGIIDSSKATIDELLRLMFGRKLASWPRARREKRGSVGSQCVLEVGNLYVKGDVRGFYPVAGVSLCVRPGEIVGIAGIAGNGQRELFEAIVGLRRAERGYIRIGGVDVTALPPGERGRLGLAIVPEERLGWALVPGKSLVFNVAVGFYSTPIGPYHGPFIVWGEAKRIAERIVERFSVKVSDVRAMVDSMSGGNMQRFIVGRELEKKPRVLIAMNPTAGLDFDATIAVRQLILDLASRGVGILLISEDLDELLELADRIAVMSRGRIVHASTPPYNVEVIAEAMVGGES